MKVNKNIIRYLSNNLKESGLLNYSNSDEICEFIYVCLINHNDIVVKENTDYHSLEEFGL